jgi:putative restriction endonuclease
MAPGDRDELLRIACFLALDGIRERHADDIPLEALRPGFAFDGERTPFLNWQKGIYRAARQRGPAALSLLTSSRSPYAADEEAEDGFWYAYRAGDAGERDNAALRAAHRLQAPVVHFRSFAPGRYQAVYPVYVEEDDPYARRVLLTVGEMRLGEPVLLQGVERRYAARTVRVRLHQGRFRSLVLPAYSERCAICRLSERRLLDAAHIRADALPGADATVRNGLSLCTIHHRAYDQDLVGIDPDHRVHLSPRLLEERDGPMLELLKGFHGQPIVLPRRPEHRPDRELLAERYARFAA